MLEKRWIIKPEGDKELINKLSQELGVDNIIANLLVQRNITTFEEAESFFRPSLDKLHDPFLMKDMEKAVARLNKAIINEEKILVYGDYDVDGTTSVALMYDFIYKYHKHIDFYIPDRYGEGYGVSYQGIDYAKDIGATLVVALDCGIKAVEKVEYAKEKGIEFIICDHHNPGDTTPEAAAVLDPKQKDCKYPYKELSGCGVGFKLIQAYAIKHNLPIEDVYAFLDLVAVSIASDIVPMNGENRILAHFGIRKLNEHPSIGLNAIIKVAGINKEIDISDIVFKIGPRINAAGRMDSGKEAVELLLSRSPEEANAWAGRINKYNTTRKDIDSSITDQALYDIDAVEDGKRKNTTVVYNPEWHKGVIGIVASRLIESYYRPTVVLTKSNGLISGSARSVEGFNLYNAIDACSDLLENYGGHMYAAGLTMKPENFKAFRSMFETIVSATISKEALIPKLELDAEINLSDITPKFYRILKQFAPFGPENMKPYFVTKNLYDKGYGKIVGQTREHLKLDLIEAGEEITELPSIAFKQAHHSKNIIERKFPFDVCYSIAENTFMGRTTLQLVIKEIKIRKEADVSCYK